MSLRHDRQRPESVRADRAARWRWVAWGIIAALGVTAAVPDRVAALYRTQATVFVRTPVTSASPWTVAICTRNREPKTYATLARSRGVAARVVADLGLDTSPEKKSPAACGPAI